MLIQRLVNDGATVTLGKEEYRFAKDEQGRFVCEVEHPAHIKRLLSIDVYRNLSGDDDVDPEPEGDTVLGAGGDEGDDDHGGDDDVASDEAQDGHKDEGSDAGAQDGEQEPAGQADKDDSDKEVATPVADMSRDELEATYKKLTGRKPHHKLGDDRLRQLIEQEQEG